MPGKTYWSDVVSGRRGNVTIEVLERIAAALKVSARELLISSEPPVRMEVPVKPEPKLFGTRDGKEVELPQDLDAIVVRTTSGFVYIEVEGPVDDAGLVRGISASGEDSMPVRATVLPSGRTALVVSARRTSETATGPKPVRG